MMDDVIVIQSEDSDNSIVELEVPKKPTPPLIHIEDEELVLNIVQHNQEPVLTENFINPDQELSVMFNESETLHSVISPDHWTSDMIKFYNDDWGDEEQFVVEKIQQKMDKSPSLWKISRKDEYQHRNKKSYMKCWNCFQRGHHFSLCPDPPHKQKCHMCGTEGHSDYSCPNSKCLNCGNYSREFVTCCHRCRNQKHELCSRCRMIGHNFINCPDHWRLFHLTTGTTSVKIPDKNIYKFDKDMWCCNCGKKGHHQSHCTRRKDCSAFLDSLPFVVSYKKAFNHNPCKKKTNETRRKIKANKKKENKLETYLRINPANKAIRKQKTELKNKYKQAKKNKRSRKKKRDKQGFFLERNHCPA